MNSIIKKVQEETGFRFPSHVVEVLENELKGVLIPEDLFDELIEYFDNKSDADGNSEGFTPNKEMILLTQLENCKK